MSKRPLNYNICAVLCYPIGSAVVLCNNYIAISEMMIAIILLDCDYRQLIL